MKIILVRHGETDYNLERRIQGHTDIPLNARGEKQAEEIAEVLHEKEKIDAVFTSDLMRASRTAQLIAGDSIPMISLRGLRERKMGEIEGMLHKDAIHKRKEDGKPSLLHYGENEVDLCTRLVAAYEEVKRISKEKGYKTALVVSHGSALNNLLESLTRQRIVKFADPEIRTAFFKRPKLGNCSVTIISDDKLVAIAEQWTESIVRERDLI